MRKNKANKPAKRRLRLNVVYMLVFLSFTSLILRAAYVQIVRGPSFRVSELNTQVAHIPVMPQRGWIYDANGQVLAYDKPSMSIVMDRLTSVSQSDIQRMSTALAPILNMPASKILAKMNSNPGQLSVMIMNGATDQQVSYIEEHHQDFPSIEVQSSYVREYKYNTLAGQVLGYIGLYRPGPKSEYKGYLPQQAVGETGLEYEYESKLQGSPGYQVVAVNAAGEAKAEIGSVPPVAGENLQLTLDGHLQAESQMIMQQEIDASPNRSDIVEASEVVLDVKTGGVLSMVSYPYLDPNWYTKGTASQHVNYLQNSLAQMNTVIQTKSYPGSTVKPANLITGLNNGVITPNYVMQDHMITMIGIDKKSDDGMNHGLVSPIRAIAVSCDTFFYEVGLWLGKWFGSTATNGGHYPSQDGSYQKYIDTDYVKGINALFQGEKNFGLGPKTGIDLPGELPGQFYISGHTTPTNYGQVPYDLAKSEASIKKTGEYANDGTPADLANAGIGQSQQFTTMQLGEYVMTLANQGKKLKPHLLENVYSSTDTPGDGSKPVTTIKPEVTGQVKASQEYFNIVKEGMHEVTTNGTDATASAVFIGAPYEVAAKTGTAQIYLKHPTDNSVFICYAPLNNPQVAIAIMVPGGGYGASLAGVIARKTLDAYFDEHHAPFMPKSQWTNTKIPSNWLQSPAVTVPEAQN